VTGSITNRDDAPWLDVNAFAFVSADPLRSSGELTEASLTDEAGEVGERITAPGTYDTIDRIAPGESAQFSIEVPSALLAADEPGVYWFGVHALGEGPDGREDGADGRARTFLPMVEPGRRRVDTALVVPLRHGLPHTPDGRLRDTLGWAHVLSPEGTLGALLDLGTAAGSRPLTWLVDPALPDAVAALAAGNPPRSIAATGDGSSTDTGPSPSPSPQPSPSSDDGTDAPAPEATRTTQAADAWLARLEEGLRGAQVLTLPYGDVDVTAAAHSSPSLYRRARERSRDGVREYAGTPGQAVAPPAGYLDRDGLRLAGPGDTVLVSDRMLPPDSPTLVRTAGRRVVATSSGASSGGPGPDNPFSPLAVRQRILAEAAVRLLRPGPQQLATLLPQHWTPTDTTGFFEGLDVGWLHLTTVADLASGRAAPVRADSLTYPREESRHEVDAANFASAHSLVRVGETLQDVLVNNTDVAQVVTDQALASTSYATRAHPDAVRAVTDRTRAYLDRQLGSIRIEAPRAVTLSSASGRFAATITNGLDQPVRVSLEAVSDEPLSITVPTEVEIGPGGRSTVLLSASTTRPGIHNVTLRVTDATGIALGASDRLPIRSAQVSNVIWLILGSGVTLLFGAIVVRLVRRLRAATRAGRESG
jgi:hypothetical protein